MALVNPYHLAAFRKAMGERNKTDRQDAFLLARYALVYQEELRAYTPPPQALQELKALVGYQEDLAARERAILNQLEAAEWAGSWGVMALLQRELAFLPPHLWGWAKASYAGLIPEREVSGKAVERSRLSKKGPPLLRRKLYMAALVAARHDPEMRAFYHRLLSRGKRKKQALLAVAHKLLRRMMGRLRTYHAG